MNRKRGLAWVSLLMAAVMALSACTFSKKDKPGNGSMSGKQPATGGELVLHVPADPDTLAKFWLTSAYANAVVARVFGGGLLSINAHTLQPEPNLAEAMPSVSGDGRTYTFKLRKDIKFHDGSQVKAQDVAFAYEILMDPEYNGPDKSVVTELETVRVVDDFTLEFTTKEVFAPFMFLVPYESPVPKAKLAGVPVKDMASHDFWKSPIGAGAWKFVEWKPGQYTLLERFDGYWETGAEGQALALEKGKKGVVGPYFDRIRLRVIPEENTAIAALEAGELTMYATVEPSHVDRLRAEKADVLNGFDWDRMGYGYQTFNNEKWPTSIKEVRQALSYALNREAIIKGVLENKATMPAGFVPPIHWVFNKDLKPYNYDANRAARFLEQAGFTKNAKGIYEKDGKPLKLTYVGTKGSSIVEGVALQSQKDWQALGIEVDLQLVDFNTLLAGLKTGDFHVTFSGLGFGVDPHTSFFFNFHSSNIRKDGQGNVTGSNRSRYNNAEVDALIDQGKRTIDLQERKKIYQKAEALIMADAPVNPIYVNVWSDFIRKDIKGVSVARAYGLVYEDQWYVNEK